MGVTKIPVPVPPSPSTWAPKAYLGNEDEAVDCGCANKDASRRESKDQVGPGLQVSGDHQKQPSSQQQEVDPYHES